MARAGGKGQRSGANRQLGSGNRITQDVLDTCQCVNLTIGAKVLLGRVRVMDAGVGEHVADGSGVQRLASILGSLQVQGDDTGGTRCCHRGTVHATQRGVSVLVNQIHAIVGPAIVHRVGVIVVDTGNDSSTGSTDVRLVNARGAATCSLIAREISDVAQGVIARQRVVDIVVVTHAGL